MADKQVISLGFSPCPNDTFIFDAIIQKRVTSEKIQIKPYIADVEELNRLALSGKIDVCKVSYHAFAYIAENYLILNSGSALGKGCGPLIISKPGFDSNNLKNSKVAIPGKYTTANLLLSLFEPEIYHKSEVLFSEIENVVLEGSMDAGVIIHENRFTYEAKGLVKVIDLGAFWEEYSDSAIPLGAIAVKRNLNQDLISEIDRMIFESVEQAFQNRNRAMEYVKQYAQTMDPGIMMQHIETYVTSYTQSLGEKGKQAVRLFFNEAERKNLIPKLTEKIFIEQ